MRRGGEEIVPVHEEGRRGEETVPVHEEGRGGEKTVHHDRAVGEEADELLLPELPLQAVRLLTKGTVKNTPVSRLLPQITIKIMLISNFFTILSRVDDVTSPLDAFWESRTQSKIKSVYRLFIHLFFNSVSVTIVTFRHRWALSPISVISDIGLSLISELPISE
jgi:hypothetical protein